MRLRTLFIVMLLLLVMVELFLRAVGFGRPILFEYSPVYGYRQKPLQKTYRMFHRYETNAFGMRSSELRKGTVKLLKVGDSVINGGGRVDQDDIATSMMERFLADTLQADVQVLNISAGSWGPDNACAFLKEHGTFDGLGVVAVFSADDYDDYMNTVDILGKINTHPKEYYTLAIEEVWDKYVVGIDYNALRKSLPKPVANQKTGLNNGFTCLVATSQEKNIPLVLYLHPTREEVEVGAYSANGEAIISFMESRGIPVIKGLPFMKADAYIDRIHVNKEGQRIIFEALKSVSYDMVAPHTNQKLPS